MSTNKGKSICVGAKGVVLSELLKHSQQRKGLVWLGRKWVENENAEYILS